MKMTPCQILQELTTKRAECRAIGRSRKQRMDNLKGILNKRNYDVTIYLVLEPN